MTYKVVVYQVKDMVAEDYNRGSFTEHQRKQQLHALGYPILNPDIDEVIIDGEKVIRKYTAYTLDEIVRRKENQQKLSSYSLDNGGGNGIFAQ